MKALRQYITEACEIGQLVASGKVALDAIKSRLSRIMSGIAAAAHVHANGDTKRFNANRKLAASAIRAKLDADKNVALQLWKNGGFASAFSRAARVMLQHPDADSISLEWLSDNFTRTPSAMLKECSNTSAYDKLRKSLERLVNVHGAEAVAQALDDVVLNRKQDTSSFLDMEAEVEEVVNVPAVI